MFTVAVLQRHRGWLEVVLSSSWARVERRSWRRATNERKNCRDRLRSLPKKALSSGKGNLTRGGEGEEKRDKGEAEAGRAGEKGRLIDRFGGGWGTWE